MNYIIIRGSKDAGKSTTIDAVCKRLNPEKVYKLIISKDNSGSIEEILKSIHSINLHNDTFIIKVKKKTILVVSGSPTEQNHTITQIITITRALKIEIDFAIIAMRSFELKDGYNTSNELLSFGNCILERKIFKILSENYRDSEEWKNRVEEIFNRIKNKLKI